MPRHRTHSLEFKRQVAHDYVAVILDAWSRRVVGYAISRSIDTRLAMAALRAAIRWRQAAAGLCPSFRSRIAVRLGDRIVSSSLAMGWSVRWAGEAIHMTMPEPRAS